MHLHVEIADYIFRQQVILLRGGVLGEVCGAEAKFNSGYAGPGLGTLWRCLCERSARSRVLPRFFF